MTPAALALLALAATAGADPGAPGDGQAALAATVGPLGDTPPAQLWLGHSWVGAERHLPVLGRLETRTDTWVLARIVDHGDRVEIEQQPCALEIRPVAGVRVGMDPAAVPRLPAARFALGLQAGERTPAWRAGWGQEDLDGDGEPGVTMRVRSALCGGELQVASETVSRAEARRAEGSIEGTLQVEVGQQVLGASGACLRAVARDTVETVRGRFRYVPAPPGATCEGLPRHAWPAADEGPLDPS